MIVITYIDKAKSKVRYIYICYDNDLKFKIVVILSARYAANRVFWILCGVAYTKKWEATTTVFGIQAINIRLPIIKTNEGRASGFRTSGFSV